MLKSLVSLSLLLAAASAQNTRTFSRINLTFTGTFNTGPNTGIPIPTTTRPPILSGDTGLLDVQCTQQYEPVCGTNGVTYGNACMLGVAVGNDASIAFLHEGECTPEYVCALPLVHGPCRRVAEERWGFDPKVGRCVTFEWACQGNANNFLTEKDCAAFCGGPDRDLMQFDPINISIPQPAPTCDFQCLAVWDPVCGSDGVTYGNGCLLALAACKNPKKNITVAHQGTCDGSGGSGGAHTLQAGFTPCGIFCDQSPNDVPVCGSNGVTYGNACLLRAAACEDKRIRKVSDGPCPPPPCPDFCPLHYDPVCGTDGVTYGNSCQLGIAACNDPSIGFLRNGECPTGACAQEPGVVGPCEALIQAWTFDFAQGGCIQFTYGGCEGNDNRFNTESDCLEECGP